MQAMIFAAGLGTRLKPLTDTMPKALVPIAGKTLLQWQIEKLQSVGIEDIIVNVHHFPDLIIDYLREHDFFGCRISISDERDELLDTGGGLRKAWTMDEPILALNVDILSNIDLHSLLSQEGNNLVVSDRQTQRYLCFSEKGDLCGWTNTKTGEVRLSDGRHFAFSGMQLLQPSLRPYLQTMPGNKFSLIDFYLRVCEKERLRAYVPAQYKMMDVGKFDCLEAANDFAQTLL